MLEGDSNPPLPPRVDGPPAQDVKGRFAPGNRLGRGNPLAGRVARIRAELLKAVTKDDSKVIAKKLIEGARSGDLAFIKEFYDRTIGRTCDTGTDQRIDELAAKLELIKEMRR